MPASLGMNSGQRLSCALCPKLSWGLVYL
jgi:hypothetical protein